MADIPRCSSSSVNSEVNSWTGSDVKFATPPMSASNSANSLSGGVGMHGIQTTDPMDHGSSSVFFTIGGGGGDDEYDDDPNISGNVNKKDLHTLNEQKRRDSIRQAYCQLEEIIPLCRQTSPGGVKLSRAAILQKGIEYIAYLNEQSAKQMDQLESLKKEVTAMRIMKENYEMITRAHQSSAGQGNSSKEAQVPEELKFRVFQGMMDSLFQSYNGNISLTSFESLSSCTITWLEQFCKPQILKEVLTQQLHIAQLTSQHLYQHTSSPSLH